MSALFESGFCVREASWHGEETLLPDWPGSWDEARKIAGLDWDPVALPVFAMTGKCNDCGADLGKRHVAGCPTASVKPVVQADCMVQIEDFNRISRSDTGATLAIMRDTFAIIDHGDMGQIVEAVLNQTNVKWETAGSCDKGRQVYCLAYLDEPIVIPGDASPSYPFLVVLNRHDGYSACRIQPTTVRVVCANTFSAAEAQGNSTGNYFAFRHTAGWRNYIEAAKEAVNGVRKQTATYVELATALTGVKVTKAQREEFVTLFIPSPEGEVVSDRVRVNIEAARGNLRGLFNGPTLEGIGGNAYGLVQAAGEYLDHLRGYRNRETYLGRTLLKPEPLKRRAIKIAAEVTGHPELVKAA